MSGENEVVQAPHRHQAAPERQERVEQQNTVNQEKMAVANNGQDAMQLAQKQNGERPAQSEAMTKGQDGKQPLLPELGFSGLEAGDKGNSVKEGAEKQKPSAKEILTSDKASAEDKLKAVSELDRQGVKDFSLADKDGKQRHYSIEREKLSGERSAVRLYGDDDKGNKRVALRGIESKDGEFSKESGGRTGKADFQGDYWKDNIGKRSGLGGNAQNLDFAPPQKTVSNKGQVAGSESERQEQAAAKTEQAPAAIKPEQVAAPVVEKPVAPKSEQARPERAAARPEATAEKPAQPDKPESLRDKAAQFSDAPFTPEESKRLNAMMDDIMGKVKQAGKIEKVAPGITAFKAGLQVDIDGAPDAHKKDRTGQNKTAFNAGGKYLNGERDNYFVMPKHSDKRSGAELGDPGLMRRGNENLTTGIYGDRGPSQKLGETSQPVARELGFKNHSASSGGTHKAEVDYVVFAGTGPGKKSAPLSSAEQRSVIRMHLNNWEKQRQP